MERFVDSTDGVRIAVYEQGNPDGPTLVLVHGWPNSHVMWDGVVPLLADRFRILAYDNRGAGASSVPKPVKAYTMGCFADDFEAVIDVHGFSGATVGLSLSSSFLALSLSPSCVKGMALPASLIGKFPTLDPACALGREPDVAREREVCTLSHHVWRANGPLAR